MNLNKFLASAALAASFGLAGPVSAAVVQVQYRGTVSSGYDTTGVFGSAGSFLDGLAYTASYTFETTYGHTLSSSYYNYAYGGGVLSMPSPVLSSTVTINGNTVAVPGSWNGQISGYNDGIYSHQSHQSQEYSYNISSYRDNNSYNYIYNYNGTLPASITAPFSYAVTEGDTAEGFVQIRQYTLDSTGYTHSADAYAYLIPDHVTIGAPIPEPETYALLLAGLGLLGFAARRRKLKEAAAA